MTDASMSHFICLTTTLRSIQIFHINFWLFSFIYLYIQYIAFHQAPKQIAVMYLNHHIEPYFFKYEQQLGPLDEELIVLMSD